MSVAKPTPGPWMAATAISSVVGLPVVAQTGRLICNVNHAHDPIHGKVAGDDASNREAIANANVIAAAPELLEAVRKAEQLASVATDCNLSEVEIDGVMVSTYDLRDEFIAALTKAEGRS